MSHYDLHHSESTITELRAQLAAAETTITDLRRKLAIAGVEGSPPPNGTTIGNLKDRLTTATALLGECESWVVCEFHHGKDNSCMTCIASNAVLTRIREATKGTHP